MVHVVSMLEAPRRLGSVSFQSKEVRGAQNSEFLFCGEGGREREREREREKVGGGQKMHTSTGRDENGIDQKCSA